MALKDNLISVWCEAASPVTDEFGSNTLTNNNGVTTTSGKVGTAGSFVPASSQYLSHANNSDLATGDIDFTLAAWVQIATKNDRSDFVFKGFFDASAVEFEFGYDAVINDRFWLRIFSADLSITNQVLANNLGSPSTNTWYYVVAWHDSVNDLIGIQVNNGTADTAGTTTAPTANAGTWAVGRFIDVATRYMDGLLNQVAFWKRVVGSTDKTALYNGGAGLPFASWDAGGGVFNPYFYRQVAGMGA